MELLNSTVSTTHPIFRSLPFSSLSTNNSSRITFSKSKKFPLFSQISSPSRFIISAHFSRRSNRQNHLRRKILENQQLRQQQEVSGNSVISAPFSQSVQQDYENFDQNSKLHDFDSEIAQYSTKSRDIKLSRPFGESVMWNKLENWVQQYKKDTEFWGVGTGTIFTVYQDSGGKVERVVVNEDEIFRRSKVQPAVFRDAAVDDISEVNEKVSFAKSLAREMEFGNNLIPTNSSVTKFLISDEAKLDNVLKGISGFSLNPSSYKMLPQTGIAVLCGLIAMWGLKMLFGAWNNEQGYTRLENEMLRRKREARMKKEKDVKGSVEVVQESTEHNTNFSIERPQFNKEKLMSSIMKTRESHNKPALPEYPSSQQIGDTQFDYKIQEIKEMARRARELEEKDNLPNDDVADSDTFDAFSNENDVVEQPHLRSLGSQMDLNEYSGDTRDLRKTTEPTPLDSIENDARVLSCVTAKSPTDSLSSTENQSDLVHDASLLNNVNGITEQSAMPGGLSSKPRKNYMKTKSRVIMSVKEAREYLSRKTNKCKENQESIVASVKKVDTSSTNLMEKKGVGHVNQKSDDSSEFLKDSNCKRKKSVIQESIVTSVEQADTLSTNLMEKKTAGCVNQKSHDSHEFLEDASCKRKKSLPIDNNYVAVQGSKAVDSGDLDLSSHDGGHCESSVNRLADLALPIRATDSESRSDQDDNNKIISPSILLEASTTCQDSSFTNVPSFPAMEIPEDVKKGVADLNIPETHSDRNRNDRSQETAPLVNKENWLEKNFHVLEPVIKKMHMGFRDNYLVAKDKPSEELDAKTKHLHLETSKYGGELEWMRDERLKEIVFKVRENELAGKDPFFQMSNEDKLAFFDGLEKKVEQENKQLLDLHEWLHTNIENLDYGTDGISLYDPLQKIMPQWRSPPMEKIHELLNSSVELRKTVDEGTKESTVMNKYKQETHLKSTDSQINTELENKSAKAPKTIIEGSDGSARAGKKSGKEYWQHTKKWSQGFLESYNAETDPEIKSVMKDIGKDLDRWVTEKEIQEAGELIDKLPERGKKFIKEKLDKVRREMKLFGPQAVVSKYREYADEKEEDYLWWLDLPYLLCIEMYVKQEGEMEVGFYSLEMAADLELDPQPKHVIAFEDAGDCKNFCYIIQAHMEMLGNGNAFVVAQQPKDAFREAKENGFGVTVIRKGQLQLNVDQPLEEVEEVISEIGSKIYHDKIMRERGVDIEALMKGVFGTGKSAYSKKSKKKLRKLLANRRKHSK
nr:COP1-interactive protein 1 [Ipomoea batatas]